MAELKDLFVVYEGLAPKKKSEEQPKEDFSRWKNLIWLLNNKPVKQKKEETKYDIVSEVPGTKKEEKKKEKKEPIYDPSQIIKPGDPDYVPIKPNNLRRVGDTNTYVALPSNYTEEQKEWARIMIEGYRRYGLNDNAIKNLLAKNAHESNWGKATHGKYNYGNITQGSWKGKVIEGADVDKYGNPIKQKYRDYSSLDEAISDEIDFLTRLYDFDQNDDISTFTNKLSGKNSGNRHYAEDPLWKYLVENIYLKLK